MVRLARENDFAGAAKLHRRLYPLFKALFIEPSPAPIKAALARARLIGSAAVRLPLSPVTPSTQAALSRAMSGLNR